MLPLFAYRETIGIRRTLVLAGGFLLLNHQVNMLANVSQAGGSGITSPIIDNHPLITEDVHPGFTETLTDSWEIMLIVYAVH